MTNCMFNIFNLPMNVNCQMKEAKETRAQYIHMSVRFILVVYCRSLSYFYSAH